MFLYIRPLKNKLRCAAEILLGTHSRNLVQCGMCCRTTISLVDNILLKPTKLLS